MTNSRVKKTFLRGAGIFIWSCLLWMFLTIAGALAYTNTASISMRVKVIIDAYKFEWASTPNPSLYYSLARADLGMLYKEVDRQLGILGDTVEASTATCWGGEPNGSGVYKRESGLGGVYATPGSLWQYVENNGTYAGMDFVSTACKWTCATGYKRNGTTNTCIGGDPALSPTPSFKCGGVAPTGNGVFKRESGVGGIQDTEWSYVVNNGRYSGDNFGSASCKWTCGIDYTRNGTTNTCIVENQAVVVTPSSKCVGVAPTGSGVYKRESGVGGVYATPGSLWQYVENNGRYSGDNFGSTACNWTCNSDFTRNGTTNTCVRNPTGVIPTPSFKCGGVAPTGNGVFKRESGVGGIQDTEWSYVVNNGRYSGDNFGSASCKWTCGIDYTRNGTTNTCIVKNSVGVTPTPSFKCGGVAPTGNGVFKRESGVGGIQDTEWSYVVNNGRYSGDNFGSASCKWACANYYTRNGTTNTCIKDQTFWAPETIYTDSTLSTEKRVYTYGDYVYGYISGGDPDNTWACIDIPGWTRCDAGNGWRQLTKTYDPTWKIDEWQKNPSNNRIELRGWLYIPSTYPVGVYKSYARTWLTGQRAITELEIIQKPTSCSWWATIGPCDTGVCSPSNIGAKKCGGTCTCSN